MVMARTSSTPLRTLTTPTWLPWPVSSPPRRTWVARSWPCSADGPAPVTAGDVVCDCFHVKYLILEAVPLARPNYYVVILYWIKDFGALYTFIYPSWIGCNTFRFKVLGFYFFRLLDTIGWVDGSITTAVCCTCRGLGSIPSFRPLRLCS